MSERTPEERERARLEREAKRTGAPLPPASAAARPSQPAPPARPQQPPPPRPAPPPRRPLPAKRTPDAGRPNGPRRAETGDRNTPARLIVLTGAALVAGVCLYLATALFQPFKGEGGERVTVTVPRGADLSTIADALEEQGVVGSSRFFSLRARIAGRTGDLKSGRYTLRADMAYTDVLDALEKGPAPARTINVTIPEGRARSEVAPIVEQAGLEGDYERVTRRAKGFDPGDYGAEAPRNLEGFLFPATYELKRGSTARDLVAKQLEAFRENFGSVSMRQARRKNLTPYEVLIIASMVEREAQLPKERPLVASVIYNRLKQGIPLGIDATIRFATGNWTEPLKQSELAIRSGYNTRTNQGLPPGPIGSPGLSSIKAAARPARTDYLFYVVKPGTCGEHSFSETDAEFQEDVNRYNREREKRGGKSPTDC